LKGDPNWQRDYVETVVVLLEHHALPITSKMLAEMDLDPIMMQILKAVAETWIDTVAGCCQ